MFVDCGIVPNEKIYEDLSWSNFLYKNFLIEILLNEVAEDQDFPKLIGDWQKEGLDNVE